MHMHMHVHVHTATLIPGPEHDGQQKAKVLAINAPGKKPKKKKRVYVLRVQPVWHYQEEEGVRS